MPRTQNAPSSRSVKTNNLKSHDNRPMNSVPHGMQTRLRKTRPNNVDPEAILIGQAPKKVKKNPKLETHFTIPNVLANQELLMSMKMRAVEEHELAMHELHTMAKIKVHLLSTTMNV